ncbi:hypothetical protein AHMF7605_28060 [Adhaeribacter arboris]|uniref:Uncharacterized protein n=1 Tax=Adhaeribacter arboris TaxID=2072846 RepID=A0A2T2YNH8_9BACT|nr:hypothetical protein [Adhaeribacter arboris]PSR57063.1 hypothetical protein AHMF7605_28060 [Adhaeribacter arboris]
MTDQAAELTFYQQLFTEPLFILPELNKEVPESLPKETEPELISPAEIAQLGSTTPVKKYPVIGENHKGLVLLVSLPEPAFQELPKNEFLVKILGAIKYAPNDVAYLNTLHLKPVNIYELSKAENLKHLIVFGKNILDMTADSKVSYYKPASIGRTPLLIAEELETIERDVNKKKQLWAALQAMFLK